MTFPKAISQFLLNSWIVFLATVGSVCAESRFPIDAGQFHEYR